MDDLIVKVNDNKIGPVSTKELRTLVDQGVFGQQDLVWHEVSNRWIPAEDISDLNSLFASAGSNGERAGRLYAIASGKGGVGKTVIAASLGVGLAMLGRKVILVDADLGGANLHTCMGVLQPHLTYFDFLVGRKKHLSEVLLETPIENLSFMSGACGALGMSNPKYNQKQRFINHLKKLSADHIIMDLGAGTAFNEIDFFLLADEQILVASTEPAAIHEAFGFIKVCLFRTLTRALKYHPNALEIIEKEKTNRPGQIHLTVSDLLDQVARADPQACVIFESVLRMFRPRLILNKVADSEEISEGMAIQVAAKELLAVDVTYLGYISFDQQVRDSVIRMKPFLIFDPKCQASQDLAALLRVKLLGKKGLKEIFERRQWRKQIIRKAKFYPEANRSENAPVCSEKCFYWGDCEFQREAQPCPVRHLEAER
ncbi:MAG: P-loop NTPase [bacterium]